MRQLKALRTAALLSAGGWVVLIDDDTAVNPTALMRLISRLSNNSRVGDEYGGGAGFIFGPEALRALSAPTPVKEMRFHMGEWSQVENVSALDLCVRRAEGGEWCRLHADWLIAHCMRASGAGLIKEPGMHQVCGRSRRPCAWLRSNMVTCHYSNTRETRRIGACMSEDDDTST